MVTLKSNKMKKYKYIIIGAALLMFINYSANAQNVSKTDAEIIAKNWIDVIIDESGGWGEFSSAEIESVQDFTRKDRKLGFFCHVKQKGFIIISKRKELAPVKAYSAMSNLNPISDDRGTDFRKTSLERILDTIESKFGTIENIESIDLVNFLESRV